MVWKVCLFLAGFACLVAAKPVEVKRQAYDPSLDDEDVAPQPMGRAIFDDETNYDFGSERKREAVEPPAPAAAPAPMSAPVSEVKIPVELPKEDQPRANKKRSYGDDDDYTFQRNQHRYNFEPAYEQEETRFMSEWE